jgi:hypothetical protein
MIGDTFDAQIAVKIDDNTSGPFEGKAVQLQPAGDAAPR